MSSCAHPCAGWRNLASQTFGLNRAEIIGRLGADVTVNHLANGGRVANLSVNNAHRCARAR